MYNVDSLSLSLLFSIFSELNRSIIYRIYIKFSIRRRELKRDVKQEQIVKTSTCTRYLCMSVDLTGSLNENAKHFIITNHHPYLSSVRCCSCLCFTATHTYCMLSKPKNVNFFVVVVYHGVPVLFYSFTMFFEIMLHIRNSYKHKICMLPKHNKMHYVKWPKIDNSQQKKLDS